MSRGVWTVTVGILLCRTVQCVDIKRLKSKHQRKYGMVKISITFHIRTGACSTLIVISVFSCMSVCVGALLFHNYMPACLKEFLKALKTEFLKLVKVRKVLVISLERFL